MTEPTFPEIFEGMTPGEFVMEFREVLGVPAEQDDVEVFCAAYRWLNSPFPESEWKDRRRIPEADYTAYAQGKVSVVRELPYYAKRRLHHYRLNGEGGNRK